MHMLHHVSLGASDIERSAAFYDAVLAPLGYVRVWDDIRPGETGQAVGYGTPGGGDKLAIKHCPVGQRSPGPGFHLAFAAPDRQAVEEFHKSAIAHGGTDNGGPGVRANYGPHYYAAFVVDPDGHRIEAVINAAV
jgi:catechol 2,3-dioxygenase-like lactoylglutathione lyase family enzyme